MEKQLVKSSNIAKRKENISDYWRIS